MGEVETIEHTRDRGVSITVFLGQSQGHASSADLRDQSVRDCVDRAVEIARYTEPDSCNGLADPDRLATEFPDLDLWHPLALDADQAIERALQIEAAGRADGRISNSEGANVSSDFGISVYGNSHGFLGRSCGTHYGQSCVLSTGQGDAMQRDYWYDAQRCFDDLEDPALTGRRAAERTVQRLGARKLKTSEAAVAFAPEVARSLLGHLLGAISGGALYRNASFLKDKIGTQLFPEWLGLAERPRLPRAQGSAAFDGEGVATAARDIVAAGVLEGYVLGSYSARRLGMQSTGNAGGVHNLRVLAQTTPLEDILSGMGNGLLVTEVMGQGVSMITGDYSRGATGFWVENGQIAYPVEEVTIAGNLRDIWQRIRAVGDDLDRRGNIQCGTIWVDRMTIAGS
jgi:PmbA protein